MSLVISEQNRRDIMNLYNQYRKDIAIPQALSLNENYAIFLDELYDIKNVIHIGNIWESLDNFKLFFNDSSDSLNEELMSIKRDINSLVLAEGVEDLSSLKYEFIQMNEQVMDWIGSKAKQFGNWAAEKGNEVVQGVKQTYQTVKKGIGDAVNAISQIDLSKAFQIVGKGVLFLARKLRDALYHPVGMILDAILVASGIGKAAQFVVWAIVVILDIYELASGDYNQEEGGFYGKLLYLGVDLIGLIFAGVAAKSAKGVVGAFIKRFGKSAEAMKQGVQQTPAIKGILTQMGSAISGAPKYIQSASEYVMKKSPKIGGWMSGIMGKVGGFLKKIGDFISYLTVGTVNAAQKVVAAPGKVVTKAAQKLGVGAEKAAKAGAATTAGATTAGLSFATDAPKPLAVPAVSGDMFAATPRDFSKGL